MPFDDKVFRHVPALRGRIIPPEDSEVRLSYERFEELDRQAIEEGWPAGWRLSHEAREANRREILHGRLDSDLWVFAYGSLIWDPALHLAEIRRATLRGWSRRFCMWVHGGRGTQDYPGLMAALDVGGVCESVALRIPADLVEQETEVLWMREMFSGAYRPEFHPVATPQGEIEALAFVMDRSNARYVPGLSLEKSAEVIARASGGIGPNFDYLDSLMRHLDELGISDPGLADLYQKTLRCRED